MPRTPRLPAQDANKPPKAKTGTPVATAASASPWRPAAPEAPAAPNWSAIEAEYRAGIKPLRLIGSENGITEGAIRKRAKKEDWERDLTAKIQAQADSLVRKEAVREEVRKTTGIPERDIVAANAGMQMTIRLEHRQDIQRSRKLFQALMGELEGSGDPDGMELIEKLFDLVHVPEGGEDSEAQRRRVDKQREHLAKVLSLPGRVDSAKRLVETLEKLVRMEREAYGIDAAKEVPENPMATLLAGIGRSSVPVTAVAEDEDA